MNITTKVYAYWRKNPYTGEDEFGLASCDFRAWDAEDRNGRVFVKEIEVSFEVPADFNPIPEQLAVLEDAKRQANAAFQQRITEIDRQIQSLLAIEHTVPA